MTLDRMTSYNNAFYDKSIAVYVLMTTIDDESSANCDGGQ